jgi:hypothetical protein
MDGKHDQKTMNNKQKSRPNSVWAAFGSSAAPAVRSGAYEVPPVVSTATHHSSSSVCVHHGVDSIYALLLLQCQTFIRIYLHVIGADHLSIFPARRRGLWFTVER